MREGKKRYLPNSIDLEIEVFQMKRSKLRFV